MKRFIVKKKSFGVVDVPKDISRNQPKVDAPNPNSHRTQNRLQGKKAVIFFVDEKVWSAFLEKNNLVGKGKPTAWFKKLIQEVK